MASREIAINGRTMAGRPDEGPKNIIPPPPVVGEETENLRLKKTTF